MGGKIELSALNGKYVTLREVRLEDAEFILNLRCDEKKAKYLHKTPNDIKKQIEYIKNYFFLKNEWYFIAENKSGKKIGTYRIYDIKNDSFCIGSWLMLNGVLANETFETDFLCKMYGFNVLGFNKIHFEVRKENKKVWKYHSNFGATKIAENEIEYFFELTKENYLLKVPPMLSAMEIR